MKNKLTNTEYIIGFFFINSLQEILLERAPTSRYENKT